MAKTNKTTKKATNPELSPAAEGLINDEKDTVTMHLRIRYDRARKLAMYGAALPKMKRPARIAEDMINEFADKLSDNGTINA